MKKILSILFICSMALITYAADAVEFKASAPAQVIMGNPFQLTYSVNQRAKDLRAPEFVDFDYIAGPYTSQSSSTSFVNGKRTSSFTLTYTYTLIPNKEGTFTLPPATIKVCCRHSSFVTLRAATRCTHRYALYARICAKYCSTFSRSRFVFPV